MTFSVYDTTLIHHSTEYIVLHPHLVVHPLGSRYTFRCHGLSVNLRSLGCYHTVLVWFVSACTLIRSDVFTVIIVVIIISSGNEYNYTMLNGATCQCRDLMCQYHLSISVFDDSVSISNTVICEHFVIVHHIIHACYYYYYLFNPWYRYYSNVLLLLNSVYTRCIHFNFLLTVQHKLINCVPVDFDDIVCQNFYTASNLRPFLQHSS